MTSINYLRDALRGAGQAECGAMAEAHVLALIAIVERLDALVSVIREDAQRPTTEAKPEGAHS